MKSNMKTTKTFFHSAVSFLVELMINQSMKLHMHTHQVFLFLFCAAIAAEILFFGIIVIPFFFSWSIEKDSMWKFFTSLCTVKILLDFRFNVRESFNFGVFFSEFNKNVGY